MLNASPSCSNSFRNFELIMISSDRGSVGMFRGVFLEMQPCWLKPWRVGVIASANSRKLILKSSSLFNRRRTALTVQVLTNSLLNLLMNILIWSKSMKPKLLGSRTVKQATVLKSACLSSVFFSSSTLI